MKSPRSEADYRETASLLVEAGAAQEVVAAELVKMGASQAVAKEVSASTRRRYQLKKVAPYLLSAVVLTAAAYAVFGWQVALFIGLFSLFGLQQLYFQDKKRR